MAYCCILHPSFDCDGCDRCREENIIDDLIDIENDRLDDEQKEEQMIRRTHATNTI